MRFPKQLYQKDRIALEEEKIHPLNYMYARHKPNVDWKIGDEFPDFSKIRSNQSFNWSAYSLPVWVRFNNQKEYYHGYGVMAYSVNTLKNAHLIDENISANMFGIRHVPEFNNYSHCELYETNNHSTKEKRAWRMMLKHNCQKHILPGQKNLWIKKMLGYSVMWYHWYLVKQNHG